MFVRQLDTCEDSLSDGFSARFPNSVALLAAPVSTDCFRCCRCDATLCIQVLSSFFLRFLWLLGWYAAGLAVSLACHCGLSLCVRCLTLRPGFFFAIGPARAHFCCDCDGGSGMSSGVTDGTTAMFDCLLGFFPAGFALWLWEPAVGHFSTGGWLGASFASAPQVCGASDCLMIFDVFASGRRVHGSVAA